MRETEYTKLLSEQDKLRVYFQKERGVIIKFILNYSSKVERRWKTILRIDTCHGYPHKHTYHARKREIVVVLGEQSDKNAIFTQAQKEVTRHFQDIKENYLFAK